MLCPIEMVDIEMVDIYTKEQKYDIISATKRVII